MTEPSCAKCKYAKGEIYKDWESFHGESEFSIVCNYPNNGDLGCLASREDIIYNWQDDTIDEAKECGTFELAEKMSQEFLERLLEKLVANGDIFQDEYFEYVFNPSDLHVAYTAAELRAIADYLDELNKDSDEQDGE